MEPIKQLLFENTESLRIEEGNLEFFQGKVNRMLDVFYELGLTDLEVNKALLLKLIDDPSTVVKEYFAAKIPDIDGATGLKNDKNKILAGLQLPDLKELREYCADINYQYGSRLITLLGLCDFDDYVQFNPERLEAYLDKYRFYATTEKEVLLYDKMQSIADLVNVLNEWFPKWIIPSTPGSRSFRLDLGSLFEFRGGVLVPRMDGFKALASKL
jgi:hypothetical protein